MMLQLRLKRECAFFDCFEGGLVPVISAVQVRAICGEGQHEREDCWMLNVNRCTPEQVERVVVKCAELFRCERAEAAAEIARRGMPIRRSQVDVEPAFDLRFFL